MPESIDLFNEIAKLRDEVEEQGEMIDTLVRASGKDLKELILSTFKADPVLTAVFLLVDGERSQGEILKALSDGKTKGASSATVSRKLDVLHNELNLIHFVKRSKAGNVYRKGRLDQVLGITRAVGRQKD